MEKKNLELGCEWHFATAGNVQEQGENNSSSEIFAGSLYPSLVREALQNSIDAAISEDKPVKVSFKFRRIKKVSYPSFFALSDRIQACIDTFKSEGVRNRFQPMLDYINRNDDTIYYLEISDTNTTGMDWTDARNGGFYSFVRCVGAPDKKTAGSGGSFGFGKAAYLNVSLLNTMLVSTMLPNQMCYFEGVTVLCTHEMNNVSYSPSGFYDSNGGKPVSEKASNLGTDLSYVYDKIPAKFSRQEPGTSVFIMGVDFDKVSEEDALKQMLETVLRHFFKAIYSGKLDVSISGRNQEPIEINSESIFQHMHKCFPEFDTAKKKLSERYNPRPYLKLIHNALEIDFEEEPVKVIGKLCEDFPCLLFKGKIERLNQVMFYLYNYKDATGTVLYMRKQNMLISASKFDSDKNFYGIFVCEDEEGNKKLKLMENPQHNRWEPERCNKCPDILTPADAQKILDDINAFISYCLSFVFPESGSDYEDIDLGDGWTIPSIMEDAPKSYETGMLVDQKPQQDESPGAPVNTELGELTKEEKRPAGDNSGFVAPIIDDTYKRDPKGEFKGGKGNKPVQKKGNDHVTSEGDEGFTPDEEGTPRLLTGQKIPVTYSTFIPRSQDGKERYVLDICSDYDVQSSRVDIVVVGEDDSDSVDIIEPSVGVAKGNSIKNVPLKRGEVCRITFRFKDNERYAIQLNAVVD